MKTVSKKKLLIALLLIAALAWIAATVKDIVVREIICRQLEAETGLEVRLEKVDYSPFSTEIEIRGLTLMNPPEFGQGEAIVIDRVYLDTGLRELLSDEGGRIERCEMDVALLRVVSGPKGSNLDAIIARVEEIDDEEERIEQENQGPQVAADAGPDPVIVPQVDDEDINIGSLELTIREMAVQSGDGSDEEKRYRLGQTLKFEEVDDLDDIAPQIMMMILMQTGTELLEDISSAMKGDEDKLDEIGDDIEEAAERIGDELKNFFK